MAIRKVGYELEKVTLNLRKGDKEMLGLLHPRLGYQKVIRELVLGHLARVQGKLDQPIIAPDLPQEVA